MDRRLAEFVLSMALEVGRKTQADDEQSVLPASLPDRIFGRRYGGWFPEL